MDINLEVLDTESVNSNTMDIDSIGTLQILKKINEEDKKVAYVVEQQLVAIEKLADAAFEKIQSGGRLIYVGAGTSGRLGILDASECPPTYGVSADTIQGLIAGGNEAIFKAQEGCEDSKALAVTDLKHIQLSKNDMLIGLAASGRTPYVIGALEYANEVGASTGSICCVEHGAISNVATYSVEAVVGAEAITGSTRMKAGTAQKLILNMISTTAMVKYGKVYQNLMVDVQMTNKKLIKRAETIVSSTVACSMDDAKDLLEKSKNDVKVAILMGITKQGIESCEENLKRCNGNVSKAIRLLKEEIE